MNKQELVQYALNLQDVKQTLEEMDKKFSTRLECLEGNIGELTEFKISVNEKVTKLESELAVARNANDLLKGELDRRTEEIDGKISSLERVSYRSAEYANYETIEISSIPTDIPDADVPEVVLSIINALDDSADPFELQDVHAIHRRQGSFTKEKVLAKFIRRGDAFFTLKNAKKLKRIDLTSIDQRLT